MLQTYKSSLGLKYPVLRNHFLNLDELWLDDKRNNDAAENLWRIHNKLYDLKNFINIHPGGKDWLICTKGTDITEAFESHHIFEYPKELLKKYYVREANEPRNSPFIFEENGFYKTLQRRVRKVLPSISEKHAEKSKIIADLLLLSFLVLYYSSIRFTNFIMATAAGVNLTLMANAAHNFFHQRDNFRMYYYDFTLISSKSWRITHVLSHHLYSNTVYDLEMSILEPFLNYLPQKKHRVFKYIAWLTIPFVCCTSFFAHFTKTTILAMTGMKDFKKGLYLPIFLFFTTVLISGSSLSYSILIFIYIELIASLVSLFIAVNSAHHHPTLFHDGDTPMPKHELDWGVHQLDTTKDRIEFIDNLFLVLTNYGNHTLHHLFPTIDHAKIKYLYPIFLKTCDDFNLEFHISTQMELIKGQFMQLVRDKPQIEPPTTYKGNFVNN